MKGNAKIVFRTDARSPKVTRMGEARLKILSGNSNRGLAEEICQSIGESLGDVQGCDVLLVDDITETAGTLTAAANMLREHGAVSVRAAVSHCILNDAAVERLKNGAIEELITTNSTPVNAHSLPVKVLSVAPLLGKAIQRISSNESVTGLFEIKGF